MRDTDGRREEGDAQPEKDEIHHVRSLSPMNPMMPKRSKTIDVMRLL
jgi:hypothetical protein